MSGPVDPRALARFLDPTPASLSIEWRSVLARRVPEPRKNQVDFIPSEVILSFCCSLLVDHSKFGSGSAHRAGFPVQELARLYKRPPTSIIAKMANLDGSRSNGGKYDKPAAAALTSNTALLQDVYLRILGAARSEGIGPADLPDFLHLEDGGDLWLFGQDELVGSGLESEVERAIRRLIDERKAEISQAELDDTERLLFASARIGQHRFASEVLRNHGHRCVFCGMSGHIAGKRHPRLLTASHIKPWRSSSNRERLDFTNGLTACPTHDVAFDTGLVTVGQDMKIHRSPALETEMRREAPLQHAFGSPPLADRLLVPESSQRPDISYLSWHQTKVFFRPQPST